MNKMRDDFDAWYELNGKSKPFTTVSIKEKMFESWKASRESLVVELPCATFETPNGDNALIEDAVFDALESAGIEVVQK